MIRFLFSTSACFLLIPYLSFSQDQEFSQRAENSAYWWESSQAYTFSEGQKDTSSSQLFYRWKQRTQRPDGTLEYRKVPGTTTFRPYSFALYNDLDGGYESYFYSNFDANTSIWKQGAYKRETEVSDSDGVTEIKVNKTLASEFTPQNDSLYRQTGERGWIFSESFKNFPFQIESRTVSSFPTESTTLRETFSMVDSDLMKVDSTVAVYNDRNQIVRLTSFSLNNDNRIVNLSEFSYFADTTIWKQSFYQRSSESLSVNLLQRSWESTSGDTLLKYSQILNVNALPDSVVFVLVVEKSIQSAGERFDVGNEFYRYDENGNIILKQISKSVLDEQNRIISSNSMETDATGISFESFNLTRQFHSSGILLHQESKIYTLENATPVLNSHLIESNRLDASESIIDSSFAITYFKSSGWDSTLTVYALTQERPRELDVEDEISTSVEQQKPSEFHVFQNYPNPFNPTTTIRYQTPISGRVQIVLYSILGQQVRILENGIKSAGMHTVFLDASDLSSGVYIYQVRFEGQVFSRKITLQK